MDRNRDASTFLPPAVHDLLWKCCGAARSRYTGRRSSVPIGATETLPYREFHSRREGMIYAMDGGIWMHRHVWKGRPLAHMVSTDKDRLLAYGSRIGISESRLQFKPLKDPRTGIRRDAWHWDIGGPLLPPPSR